MSAGTGRVLALLALLQSRPSWTGAELAERLEVTDRTVRRDVDRLRQLGYPVEAVTGAAGGYQLGRGGRLPPLLLGDEEAMAVAFGLRAAVDGSVTGLEEAALSVLARLDQLLPSHLAARVRALHEATANLGRFPGSEQVASEVLLAVGQACARSERVRFAYADRRGQPSDRLVEPHRLVRVGSRWYLVARDVDRRDWRTFRMDRVGALEAVGTTFSFVDPPDAVAMVRNGLQVRAFPYEARVAVPLPAIEAADLLPSALGIEEVDEGRCVAQVGSMSVERMVRYLASLPVACEVLDPPDLRAQLQAHAERLVTSNR